MKSEILIIIKWFVKLCTKRCNIWINLYILRRETNGLFGMQSGLYFMFSDPLSQKISANIHLIDLLLLLDSEIQIVEIFKTTSIYFKCIQIFKCKITLRKINTLMNMFSYYELFFFFFLVKFEYYYIIYYKF